VVAWHLDDESVVGGRWDAEGVPVSLQDQRRNCHRVELVESADCIRPARRPQWKSEAEHSDSGRRLGSSAGNPCPQGPAAGHERQARQPIGAQEVDCRPPHSIELTCRCRAPASRNTIGLLDERDAEPFGPRYLCYGYEIGGGDSSTGSMTENQHGTRFSHLLQMDPRQPMQRLDIECRHPGALTPG
jgi:hypothetical protein